MPLAFTSVADLLDEVLDELLRRFPSRSATPCPWRSCSPSNPEPPDARAVAAFLASLRALARDGPVVVAVDDVQWLDPPSAATIAFALRRLRTEPVGFLLTRRTPSPSPLGLDRPPGEVTVMRQTVGPLTLAALQRLLRLRLGEVLPARRSGACMTRRAATRSSLSSWPARSPVAGASFVPGRRCPCPRSSRAAP